MPLAVGSLLPPIPPAPPEPVEVRDAATARWIDPVGTEWPLSVPELGWFTLDAVTGLGATPIAVSTDPAPRGGTSVRHIQPQARTVIWPLHVYGATTTEFLDRYRQLARAFTRTRRGGAGTLVISRADGSEREIAAYYQDGFGDNPGAYLADDVALSLYCPDGFWRARDPLTQLRAYATTGTHLNPYPTISSGDVLGATVLSNPGDAEAYPEWTITGPASLITVSNVDTGEGWTLNPNATGIAHGNLLAGETVTVTTEPPAIRGPAGAVWTAALNWPGAVLWPLEPGETNVAFTVTGSGPGTSISLAFHPRYETA